MRKTSRVGFPGEALHSHSESDLPPKRSDTFPSTATATRSPVSRDPVRIHASSCERRPDNIAIQVVRIVAV